MVDTNRGLGLGPIPASSSGAPPTGAAGGGLAGTYPNPTVATNANLTGPITSTGNATAVASQTGTGTTFVMNTSPALVTPLLGTPTSGVLTNCTGYPTSALPSLIRLAASDCTAHAISSGTAEVVLKTFSFTAANIAAIAAGSVIRVQTLWTFTGSTNAKTFRVRLGAAGAGTGGTALMASTTSTAANVTLGRDVIIFCRTASSQIVFPANQNGHEGVANSAPTTGAINLAADFELAITGQPASAGETVQLEAAMVEILIP